MYLERLLQINIATMAAMGTLLLALGQRNVTLPLWTLIAAGSSVWLTDITGWFRLNRMVTAAAALIASFALVWQLAKFHGVDIYSIANFLVYLQIILLFQEKEVRTYGQLALLSLLQVVVAAVFNQGVLFGFLLVAYLFVALSGLMLMFMHCERTRARMPKNRKSTATPGNSPIRRLLALASVFAGATISGVTGRRQRNGDNTEDRTAAAAADSRRWPLGAAESSFSDSTTGFAGQGGVWRELPRRVVGIALGSLVLSLVVFTIFPRSGRKPWKGAGTADSLAVGFSGKVALGELGSIIENPQEVLRVHFFDGISGEPYRVFSTVYLRGVVMTHYEKGEWEFVEPSLPQGPNPSQFVQFARSRFGARPVLQKIVIEPMGQQHDLFAVWPFMDVRGNQRLLIEPRRQRMLRASGTANRRFQYELITTALDRGMQLPLVPVPEEGLNGTEVLPDGLPSEGPGALPLLADQAERWLQSTGLSDDDRYACAKLLEQRLRDSGQFEYSLEGQARDLSIDPIEDFISNNPRGHCEYFATALTLMLRSRGIPARMLIGFKCDEWNPVGRFFQVRQLHAHTWVEAYLEPEHVSDALLPEAWRGKKPAGAWLRLDPTPAGATNSGNSLLAAMRKSVGGLNFAWSNYVMDMDQSRQRQAIYDPLADSIKQIARRLSDPAWWKNTFTTVTRTVTAWLRNLVRGNWFSVRGGLVGMAAALLLVVVYHAFRFLIVRPLGMLLGWIRSATAAPGPKVGFYRRLESLLARRGLRRLKSQTQRDFAQEAGEKIAAATGRNELAVLVSRIVEEFYRVRFGKVDLDDQRRQEIEQALGQLRQAGRKK